MRVALFQQDIVWCSRERNLQRAEEAFGRLFAQGAESAEDTEAADGTAPHEHSEKIDLVVLPEMFATGFQTDPRRTADRDGSTAEWMRRMAARYDAAVAGSVAVETEDGYRNRLYFVRPDGRTVAYDKRHLFSFGGEDRHFTAGRERTVVEWRGVRILLQVCYDLRFPVFARCRDDYDMIIYAAEWPAPRIGAWNTLLRARAIENQCYVAGVNRVGHDPACDYSGGTALIDPYGRCVASCPDHEEGFATGTVDIGFVRSLRKRFPALADRDRWQLEQ